nr:MAG TPA: Stealth protein CR1, conserved region 1 [Caudoviricetes sp.]
MWSPLGWVDGSDDGSIFSPFDLLTNNTFIIA